MHSYHYVEDFKLRTLDSRQTAEAEVEQWLRDIEGAIADGQYLMRISVAGAESAQRRLRLAVDFRDHEQRPVTPQVLVSVSRRMNSRRSSSGRASAMSNQPSFTCERAAA